MSKNISNKRKGLYYTGLGMTILGVILFLSSFFSFFAYEPSFSMEPPSFFKRAVVGIIMIGVGGAISNVGAKGVAGSGLVLDPEKAREDLKPYNLSKGQMINDVVGEIDIVNNLISKNENIKQKEIIKVKCQSCSQLNDEDSRFCKFCGKNI